MARENATTWDQLPGIKCKRRLMADYLLCFAHAVHSWQEQYQITGRFPFILSRKDPSSDSSLAQTPQPPQPPPTLNDIISEFRRAAITDTQFLGHPDALRRKTWIGSERGKRILVDRRQPDEPAIFWLIGEISDEDFWLYPDGGLNANLAPTTLTSHHATAFLTRPQNERLGRLFDAALTTAAQSESLKRNPEVLTKDHLVRTLPRNDKRYLRIKHRILTVC